MGKVDLTHKTPEEQVRIIKAYLSRRNQHKNQGPIKISQLSNRFKHKRFTSDKLKLQYFKNLLSIPEGQDEIDI
jgi:hypothetical protein